MTYEFIINIFPYILSAFFYSFLVVEVLKVFYDTNIPKKNFLVYLAISTTILTLVSHIPQDFSPIRLILAFACYVIILKFILRVKLMSSLVSVGIFFTILTISDILSTVILINEHIIKSDSLNIRSNITYSLIVSLFSILLVITTITIIRFVKFKNNNIRITFQNKTYLTFFYIILSLLYVALNYYIYLEFSNEINYTLILLNILIMVIFFVLSIYSLYNSQKLIYSDEENLQLKSYINTINKLHDELKRFRHNYLNILQGIQGYADISDINGIKKFLHELNGKNQSFKNIDVFDLSKIDEPSLKSLLFSKLTDATNKNIKIILETSDSVSDIHIGASDLCEIIGVFLDNAIEECEKLDMNARRIEIIIDNSDSSYMIVIANTYKEKPDINKLFKKGFTTKSGDNHGVGLYEVKNILNSYNNILLNTHIEHDVFIQELQIK
ncbi:MAG TPA: hypothetical protein DEP72_07105 [Clostridiales bacterium]|nr:MAG: hypothetical protein A2Y18_00580 [Clostridiales bacterium GWD2_32_19]HCC07907.1 hypothetical protein [Clostridiales bacterium]